MHFSIPIECVEENSVEENMKMRRHRSGFKAELVEAMHKKNRERETEREAFTVWNGRNLNCCSDTNPQLNTTVR